MTNATLEREFWIETPNKPGIAGELTSLVSGAGNSNIKALMASVVNGKGHFTFIPENFSKVKEVLTQSGFNNFREDEVLVIRVPDHKGSASDVTNVIGKAGINIKYFWTTIFDNTPAVIVSTDNNQKAISLFN